MSWIRQPNYNSVYFSRLWSLHIFCKTKNWAHRDFLNQWSLVHVVLAGRIVQAAGWQVVSQHTMARARWTLQQQRNRKGRVAARKRKGDRKKRQVKLPWRVIFSQQYLHVLPYALPVYYDCTPHRAGPHHDSDRWPRSTSAGSSTCPGKQVFSPPAFKFLLVFHFFTDTRDLNGKLDIFLLLILPTSILLPAWVSGWPQGKPSWSIWEEIEKETCRVAVWAHGDSH